MRRLIMSHLIKIYTVFHSVLKFDWDLQLKQWFCTRFKDGRLHFRKSGINGLMQKQIIPCHSSEESETLRGLNTFSGKATVKVVCHPSEKGSTLKEKKNAPLGRKDLPITMDPISERGWRAGKQTESHKSCLPYQTRKIHLVYPAPLKTDS